MRPGVVCEPTGNKDEIQVRGNDLELVSSSGEWTLNQHYMCSNVLGIQ